MRPFNNEFLYYTCHAVLRTHESLTRRYAYYILSTVQEKGNYSTNRVSLGSLCEVVVGGLEESLIDSRMVQIVTCTRYDHGQVL